MDTFSAMEERRSIRKYAPGAVPKDLIEKLVEAARYAPSARAIQPWEFVVVTHTEVLKELGRLATNGAFLEGAAFCIAVFCRETKYYLEDGCAATENILIAAAASGLGACWIAGDKKPYASEVARLLQVPPDVRLVSLISAGWPAEEPAAIRRRGLGEVLHWEKY
ncbi:MAG: nitroreductase family protein [Candidatus Omnitrophota bacterium]|jgi:nitroreductase